MGRHRESKSRETILNGHRVMEAGPCMCVKTQPKPQRTPATLGDTDMLMWAGGKQYMCHDGGIQGHSALWGEENSKTL